MSSVRVVTPKMSLNAQRRLQDEAVSRSLKAWTNFPDHSVPLASGGESDNAQNWAFDMMASHVYRQQQERLWISDTEKDQGVVIQQPGGDLMCYPPILQTREDGFARAVEMLNVGAAITLCTNLTGLVLRDRTASQVRISGDLEIQILPSIVHLARCQKHQYAAFIADRQQLIVWDDDPKSVIERAADLERGLLERLWEGHFFDTPTENNVIEDSTTTSSINKEWNDVEARVDSAHRPVMLFQSIHTASALCLTCAALGLGWRAIAIEMFVDQGWIRIIFIPLFPIIAWLGMFFFQALVGNVLGLLGPIKQMSTNSRFYSATSSVNFARNSLETLPHVTVQMPVYKESLSTVIAPTIKSVQSAISTYRRQGGSANIFVNDDGMQLLSSEEAQSRQRFYKENNIGWVARPRHNPCPADGTRPFHRRGKFKKASNLNYALRVSMRVEQSMFDNTGEQMPPEEHEGACYQAALADVLDEDEGRTWAEGNVRVGDYILLIDSDTRVPTDCFLDAMTEMTESPDVAIVQFASGVLNVTDSYFERGITFFTELVYTQIRFAVANGDVAPFVGHNAFIRWSAMQQLGYICRHDSCKKYWSETTVSEDFDMALRLQAAGYLVRLATYGGNGFQEGVSLTVYDELARWEKYAYGCSEFVFHPLRYWITKGPFTPIFRAFIVSCIPLYSKITILAYVGTYFAIGSAWILTLLNYFLIGWFNGFLDHYYLDSFKSYFAIVVVFTFLGNVSLAVLRYRIEDKPLISGLRENIKWIPLLVIFLGGISLHISQAILCHLLSIDRSWTSTAKEAEDTTFFKEIPKVWARFKGTFCFCIGSSAMMIALAIFVPPLWQIRLFIAIWPLAVIVSSHFLLPIVLNPGLMLFTW